MTQQEIQNSLENLSEGSNQLFGKMTPQHMVEHLIITFKLSSGRVNIPEFEPNEKQLEYKRLLLRTDMEFPKGVRAPGLPAELLPLRFDSLHTAKEKLIQAMEEFENTFSEAPDLMTLHPRFGKLTYTEWKVFHDKHLSHHLGQFE
jgi:oxepin-CoA hydrolase/3-oxo-5,6-dehydrosuberyl-CoA semialdehyde dehydrogenase